MKRFLSILLAAAVLIGSAVFAGIPQAKAEMNEVTILAYICGTDLESDEGEASADIREFIEENHLDLSFEGMPFDVRQAFGSHGSGSVSPPGACSTTGSGTANRNC